MNLSWHVLEWVSPLSRRVKTLHIVHLLALCMVAVGLVLTLIALFMAAPADLSVHPFWLACCCVLQVYTCEQVLSYLRQFVVVEKKVEEEKKAVDAPAPGMKLLNKKTLDAEADALWGSVTKTKGKGARKAAEKQKAAEAVKVGSEPVGAGTGLLQIQAYRQCNIGVECAVLTCAG